MSRSSHQHLVSSGRASGSARQDPLGLPGQNEVGAALHSPRGAAPSPVSAAGSLPPWRTAFSPVSVLAAAALTMFEGQAVFAHAAPSTMGIDRLFRFRRGSRTYVGPELQA